MKKAMELFKEKIHVFDNGEKWFINDFIDFQYGELNPENRAHKSVIDILHKYKIKGLIRSLQGRKDKDKDKDMVKDKDKDMVKEGENLIFEKSKWFDKQVFFDEAPQDWSAEKKTHWYDQALGYSQSKGAKYRNWIASVKNWDRKTPYAEKSKTGMVR